MPAICKRSVQMERIFIYRIVSVYAEIQINCLICPNQEPGLEELRIMASSSRMRMKRRALTDALPA